MLRDNYCYKMLKRLSQITNRVVFVSIIMLSNPFKSFVLVLVNIDQSKMHDLKQLLGMTSIFVFSFVMM